MAEEHDPIDIAGQERIEAENASEERRRRDEEISDLCKVMSSKEGRRFMRRLLSDAGVYRLSYSPGMDAMTTAFNEGNRNTGLKVLTDVMASCRHLYAQMNDEHEKAKERDEQRRANRRSK